MRSTDDIAVTGIGLISAVAATLDEFVNALRIGRTGIRQLDGEYSGISGALLDDFNFRSALEMLVDVPEDVKRRALIASSRASKCSQAAIYSAISACQNASLFRRHCPSGRIGLIVAGQNLNANYTYDCHKKYANDLEYLPPSYGINYLDTHVLGEISETLNITGPGLTVGGASASGNVSIVQAIQLLKAKVVDVCLVVGAMAELSPLEIQGFRNMGAMGCKTLQGADSCRPFDELHEGFVYGQGSGCLVLERQDRMAANEKSALAYISGVSLLMDGNRSSNPSVDGEIRCMRQAVDQSGIDLEQVDYVNTHGSSSPLGDETEILAIKTLFKNNLAGLWVNSTKEIIGHCLYSAGVMECIATIVQLSNNFLHPNKNLQNPIDDDVRFVGREYVETQVQCALSNSFGFSGINSSVLVKAA